MGWKSKEALREYILKNKERRLENTRRWYHRNKEKELIKRRAKRDPKKWAEQMREYRLENPSRIRAHKLKMTYGMTMDQFNSMVASQNNKCAICLDLFIKTPNVDHCHRTGMVRSLLCSKCNTGIGYFRESEEILESAKQYLRRWK